MSELMVEKFPPRKDELNLKDIYQLLQEAKNDLRIVQAKNPYNHLFTQSLEVAIKKITYAENRLSAECFIDGLYISNVMAYLKERDNNISMFRVAIRRVDNCNSLTFPPYELIITGE